MAIIKDSAPAKINLTLHVTGQRSDGYHLLDSLVVFAGICDEITATIAPDLQIKVGGPFAMGVPTDDTNLIMRAAYALRAARGVTLGAHLTLEKNLPHAAGIGSGSSDAAMALSMLAALWDVEPLSPKAPEVIALGADVPVCMKAPSPIRMEGIGERLTLWPALPDCALVLVNPMVDVPTGAVFAGLKSKKNASMGTLPAAMDFDKFASWLSQQRNDLEAPARNIAPQVDDALKALGRMPQVVHAGMSGSGATCYGLVRTIGDARQVARTLQVGNMGWWVAPAPLL
ncbi:MAG: 4-(cytidine 5'-diphospho)-2-C-methyl-D-erythritol kinase [Loktanella sp.]|jgi:4-diphosphocytidyl-2-C-methyl-D-erythritol kinase|nr:4-(cytidine 5'-diphospho)-2-C-methyl-D-erythritol kinase [Loktanella sp.]MDO7608533.1 4-(cytidine 5'-diphospho)-2-C-methyl-D-erythritol kinase [Loktanella sp.]MDO7624295.1 4-(cytidine 5'-diphospho)-2-C-methyl-D-erythritol kinase [Loktanella sp.]MDO7627558.1 4-(cytidine 5'-diphospho)-2-C-methyl-D-erythritol kinase [Loktanella sp.]MDO7665788.1 4-(cytidine 5'-diphospho)-2-C-methyl-D-erythritol kinase [Loktanella sp.]